MRHGFHVNEDRFIVEVVNPETGNCVAGSAVEIDKLGSLESIRDTIIGRISG